MLMAADAILHWNAIALQALANDVSNTFGPPQQVGPTGQSRAMAIVSVAMFDAINSIQDKFQPYLVKVAGMHGANIDAAVGQAAYDTLTALFPNEKTAVFDVELATWLNSISNNNAKTQGIALGHATAAAILNARANDGANVVINFPITNEPGHWQPDPLHPTQTQLAPQWGAVTPFGINDVDNFTIPPPPALDSKAYTRAYNQVMSLGSVDSTTRTAEQTEIGIFWAYDGTKGLGTPVRLYNQIATTLAVQENNTEYENARMFALVNVAMADAGIAAWNAKYVYDFWRPVTAIRDGADDGNPNTVGDPNWTPLGAPASNQSGTNFTPPFPAYDSGHATFGAALFETLTRFYGRNHITFTFTSDELNGVTTDADGNVRPLEPRTFHSFTQAAKENAISRIYLGIHWIFDAKQGLAQGSNIADYVFKHEMEPLHRSRFANFDPHLMWHLAMIDGQDGTHSKWKVNPFTLH